MASSSVAAVLTARQQPGFTNMSDNEDFLTWLLIGQLSANQKPNWILLLTKMDLTQNHLNEKGPFGATFSLNVLESTCQSNTSLLH